MTAFHSIKFSERAGNQLFTRVNVILNLNRILRVTKILLYTILSARKFYEWISAFRLHFLYFFRESQEESEDRPEEKRQRIQQEVLSLCIVSRSYIFLMRADRYTCRMQPPKAGD